jgi:glycerate kinase
VAFCGGRLEPGVQIVIEAARLREKMSGADLCLTGEGRLDSQTCCGKTPAGVAGVAREAGALAVGVAGAVDLDSSGLQEVGLAAAFSLLNAPMTLEQAMTPTVAAELLAAVGEQIVKLFLAARIAR